MKATIAMLLLTTLMVVSAPACWAEEKEDHICFSVLDADQDGIVTFQEFEPYYGGDKAAFDAADANKDGKLTHDEYHSHLGHGSQE